MAFPTVGARNSNSTESGTSHSVSLPASIGAGELLIAFFNSLGSVTHTTPGDWSLLTSNAYTGGSGGRISIFYKTASGSEGASVSVTTSGSAMTCHTTYRITDWTGTPEFSTVAASINPDSLSPSWGAADTLWLAVAAATTDGASEFDAAPTSFTNLTDAASSSELGIGSAERQENAASQNPATFGNVEIVDGAASYTLGIQPAGAAAGQPIVKRMGGVKFAHRIGGVW